MEAQQPPHSSPTPRWSWTTKLVIGLVLAAMGILLVITFRDYLGLILMAFIIAYLLYPVANLLRKLTKLRWRISVAIVFVFFALIFIGLLTWGGFAIFGQVENLINFIKNNIDKLPGLIESWTSKPLVIGPFELDLPNLNWDSVADQAIGAIQPILGQAGSLMGKLISGGANLIFRLLIMFLVSFFVLSETEGIPDKLIGLNVPGYTEDMRRLGKELGLTWNAFIRGELIVVGTAIMVYTGLLGAFQVSYFFGLAVIAGLGRFIPYLGAWIAWISFGLVSLLQPSNPFGLAQGWYTLIVVGVSLLVDNILDHILTPKVMGNALKVHPAAILISALIGAKLLGLVGVILAAPVFASLQLVVRYLIAKMADRDPWETLEYRQAPKTPPWMVFFGKLFKGLRNWLVKVFKGKSEKTKAINSEDKSEDEKLETK